MRPADTMAKSLCWRVKERARSSETTVPLGVPGAGVGLDVGLLDASAGSEMSLGLTHGGSSEEESVSA